MLDRIHHTLYVECREQSEREASPTAAIIDSQSVKSAEKGGPRSTPPGYDAGRKIKGKKRHLLVDTLGLLLHAIVHPAGIAIRHDLSGQTQSGMIFPDRLLGVSNFIPTPSADADEPIDLAK
jgi:hypothetical protein